MIAAAIFISAFTAASVFDAPFQRGNDAYETGDYVAAINAYEQLVAEGVEDESLFYNLGNAYYRAGKPGAAVLNYERALRLQPTHQPARQNLDFVVSRTAHQWSRPLPPSWEQTLLMWHYDWTPYAVRVCAMLCWWVFWILLALRLWKPNRWLTRAAVLVAMVTFAFAASSYAKTFPPPLAIAMKDNTPVRYAIGESQTVNFELMEGDRVVLDERSGEWIQLRAADGQRGWAQQRAFVTVGPPYLRPEIDPSSDGLQTQ